jgi:isoquinoline 1-oxidoreductase beta subunit
MNAPREGFDGVLARGVSRRAFLVSSGALTLGVAFGSLATARRVFAQSGAFSPNGWVHVGRDGAVTLMSPASEMGQGVMTSMPLLLAEEMDLDWSRCRVEQAPTQPRVFGNPRFGGGMTTGASRTTQGYYEPMRLAGLQARLVMMQAAADKWGVPVGEVVTEPHAVVHRASGRRMSYGDIAAFAQVPAQMPVATKEMLKPASQFRLIGKDVPRVDVPSKTNGTARYGIDVRRAGILYGAVLAAPVQGEKPLEVDDRAARQVPGVKAVVTLPYGVGVVADSYPAAQRAKAALKVKWSETAKARAYDSDKVRGEYLERARTLSDHGVDFVKHGDALKSIAGAARTFTAEYTSEHVAHTCMEPMNCTAQVTGDRIEVWAPSQSPFFIHAALQRVAGFKPENIESHVTLLGGGFGRRVEADYVLDAALLARAADGWPVKVVWSREDDIRRDKFRPLTAQHLTAATDAQGNIVALRHRLVAESIYARAAPPLFQQAGGRDTPVNEGAEIKYAIPDHLVEYMREQRGIDVGFWRAVGPGYTKFAIETLVDEVAKAYNRDPLDYRIAMFAKDARGRAVMEEVARLSSWKQPRPAGRALGVAFSDAWNSYIGMVVEVSVDRATGRPRVHEVWTAVDCGVALQPKNVETQIESGVIYGLSAALAERITIKGGQVQQSNFHDYPILRMAEAPRVTTRVLPTANHPGGIGEVGLPPLAPAMANAIAVLTGKRLRSLPFDYATLKA